MKLKVSLVRDCPYRKVKRIPMCSYRGDYSHWCNHRGNAPLNNCGTYRRSKFV